MSIPRNISRENIEKAIGEIDPLKIPAGRLSRNYFLVFGDKTLPPKYVVCIANKYANDEVLDWESFNAVEAKNYLKKLGFSINEKHDGYYHELIEFLSVAKKQITGKGTTKEAKEFNDERIQKYKGLEIDISFGKGRATAIPWIAFLNNNQMVQDGIYPVYLFYKDINLLVLAYGVSETNKPQVNWNLSESKSIERYFIDNDLGTPQRYGNSFVFKVYDTNKTLNEDEIDSDLIRIINIYKKISFPSDRITSDLTREITAKSSKEQSPQSKIKEFNYSEFYSKSIEANFFINESLCLRFAASLLTKPFVILTGLSGSGKTKLAQAFSIWICENERQYLIVPVGADWTNREPLLGFPNALEDGKYLKPDNGVLDLIIDANQNPDKPFFLILDEMNLSHVERYFADFLSAMESKETISLHPGSENWSKVPPKVSIPLNLFIIGTVNIDETTYMFSPKVLDRANVIEFRVDEAEMKKFLNGNTIVDFKKLNGQGISMARDFLVKSANKFQDSDKTENINDDLINFFRELKAVGAEFGYRTASEIVRFVCVCRQLNLEWSDDQILDAAIMQKFLPKLHGSRRKLEPTLKSLAELCLRDKSLAADSLNPKKVIDFEDNKAIKFPIALEKIRRMNISLMNNNFTSYAEG